MLALDGGPDGLDAYRRIAAGAPAVLAEGGRLLVEIGAGQAAQVSEILREAGLKLDPAQAIRRDLAGRPRVVAGGLVTERRTTGSQGQKKAWRTPMFRLGSCQRTAIRPLALGRRRR